VSEAASLSNRKFSTAKQDQPHKVRYEEENEAKVELGEDVGLWLAVKSTQLNAALREGWASLFIAASGAQSSQAHCRSPWLAVYGTQSSCVVGP
jgi:hypothetical protein